MFEYIPEQLKMLEGLKSSGQGMSEFEVDRKILGKIAERIKCEGKSCDTGGKQSIQAIPFHCKEQVFGTIFLTEHTGFIPSIVSEGRDLHF